MSSGRQFDVVDATATLSASRPLGDRKRAVARHLGHEQAALPPETLAMGD